MGLFGPKETMRGWVGVVIEFVGSLGLNSKPAYYTGIELEH